MWPQIIEAIIASGYTEQQIADKVGLSQPTINRLKLGSRKRMEYRAGELLLKLHRKAKRKS
jgi:transcriptional regulator with XRE-family HTH domain